MVSRALTEVLRLAQVVSAYARSAVVLSQSSAGCTTRVAVRACQGRGTRCMLIGVAGALGGGTGESVAVGTGVAVIDSCPCTGRATAVACSAVQRVCANRVFIVLAGAFPGSGGEGIPVGACQAATFSCR